MWTAPVWGMLTNWFTFGAAPAAVWTQPLDYGTGGNVVYQDHSVYIDGQEVATAENFAMSTADVATEPPPATEEEEAAEWMPLGAFVVSSDQQETAPSRVIQLCSNEHQNT